MNRLGLSLVLMTFIFGCAPKQGRRPALPEAYQHNVLATGLKVEPNHESLLLSWQRSGQGAISGYNIYISERPLAALYPDDGIDPAIATYNTIPFPGDTVPEDAVEHFKADGLRNGVRYFVSVRVVYPDRSVSRPSNEVVTACGGRGEIELAVRYFGLPDGYSFENNTYVASDSAANDLYFFSKNGVDYLASPKRLDAFINETRFVILPYRGAYDQVIAELAKERPAAVHDQVEVKAGDWVLLACARDTYALVMVKELKGLGKERRVVLTFAYSSLKGDMLF